MKAKESEQYFRRIMDTTVKMSGNDHLRIESVVKDKYCDFVLETSITLPGNTIVEARGELKEYAEPERYQLPIRNILKLAGMKIGPGFIRQVKDILGNADDVGFIIDAMVETARGYMALNDVAGVSPPADLDFSNAKLVRNFEVAIRPEFLNTCITYKEGVEKTFESRGVSFHLRPDIYGPKPGQINRFRRDKVLELQVINDGLRLQEYLIDDGHEMMVEFFIDKNTREVQKTNNKIFRVPYQNICELPFMRINELVGSHLDPDFRDLVHKIVGGSSGCAHLVDMIFDMARYLDNAH
jgi:hypothetical protein